MLKIPLPNIFLKYFLLFLLIILFAMLVMVLKYEEQTQFNNLKSFSSQLIDYPLPSDSIALEHFGAVGTLTGMGNNLSYCSILLVKSKLNEQQLHDYYTCVDFLGAQRGKDLTVVTVTVKSATSKELKLIEIDNIRPYPSFHTLSDVSDFNGYYYIVLHDGIYNIWECVEPKTVHTMITEKAPSS